MDATSAKRIKRNLVFFKENITQLSKVMDKLIETDSISMEEKAEILAEKSVDTQCHLLLELLMKRGGFDSLIESLKISGNGHVADKILKTDVCSQKGTVSMAEKIPKTDDVVSKQNDKNQLQKADTFFVFDDRKEEIIQLIKEREMVKMKYNELSNKYRKIKTDNKTKSEDIKILNEEIDSLRCQLAAVEKRASNIKDELKKRNKDKDKKVEPKPKLLVDRRDVGIDAVDGPLDEVPKDVGCHIDSEELLLRMEEQTISIETLTEEATHYNNLIETLEDQIEELKASIAQKDNNIMTLRNNVGKLQVHLQAGRQEREKISAELRAELDKNQKRHDERFDQIDDKMEYIIKLITMNRNVPRQQKQNKFNKKFGR
ncbi:kinesin-like protein KIF15-A [Mytilus californianus]|uniref:kinesin-like protein KIF15-A n=1 Tax=Mytilus californianus TaxID=6549 RepID=UPI0022452098|nr:kinesin-like protein KIF15-A [Mytilus californianus]